jgi:FtsH-binding integral membrane protein
MAATAFTQFAQNLNNKIEPGVRQHLAKVYSSLTATIALAAIGSYVHLFGIWEAGLMSAIASLGLVLGLHFTPDNGKNLYTRFGMLLGFGFCSGHTLGPLLDHVIFIDPQIVVSALVGTCVVFVSFSIAALLAVRGQYLFLGGILMSVLNTMAIFGLANLFFRSTMIFQAQLYIGLVVMSAFILYDTQAIMEKYRMGSRDYVGHSLDLFFDFISVFRRLLIILTQKEQNQRRRRKSE